jgi:hypothetical protein
MRIDRRVSPNQTALWSVYELHNSAGQRPARVRLACYYRRSTGVNGGHSSHLPAQVRAVEHGRPPIFQAGHAGSIPVTRSTIKRPGHSGSDVHRASHLTTAGTWPCPTASRKRRADDPGRGAP